MSSPSQSSQQVSRWELGLGLVYVVAGLGLLVAIVSNSVDLFLAAGGALLLLVVLSVGTIVWREGLITPENKVIGACVLAALGLLFGLFRFTNLPSELIFGIVFLVGVIVPHLLVYDLGYGQ